MTMQAPEEDLIEPLRRIVGSARTDIQKLLAAVEKLRNLTNEPVIDRMAVRSALVDLKLGVEGGKWTTMGALVTLVGPLMENADAEAKKGLQPEQYSHPDLLSRCQYEDCLSHISFRFFREWRRC